MLYIYQLDYFKSSGKYSTFPLCSVGLCRGICRKNVSDTSVLALVPGRRFFVF